MDPHPKPQATPDPASAGRPGASGDADRARRMARKVGTGRPGQSTILLGVTFLAILGFIAVPVLKSRRQDSSAAEDARATYLSLMSQMESGVDHVAAGSSQDTPAPRGDLGVSEEGAQPARLERDLFAPAPRQKPVAEREAARAAKRQPPALTGIFIDGAQSKAVVGGKVIGEGDWVKGFQVAEIHRDWVLLRRGEQVERLELGGR